MRELCTSLPLILTVRFTQKVDLSFRLSWNITRNRHCIRVRGWKMSWRVRVRVGHVQAFPKASLLRGLILPPIHTFTSCFCPRHSISKLCLSRTGISIDGREKKSNSETRHEPKSHIESGLNSAKLLQPLWDSMFG